jgi:hypothetical protein
MNLHRILLSLPSSFQKWCLPLTPQISPPLVSFSPLTTPGNYLTLFYFKQFQSNLFLLARPPIPGPIVLVLVCYQLYGLALGFIIKQLFWLPHRFRYGIYMAAGWGNYGDVRKSNTRYYLA